jgi:uncharacterized membrane protein YhaH (DUF805 family)
VQKISAVEWALRPLRKYAVFWGRAARPEYWWFYLGITIVSIPVTILDRAVGDIGVVSIAYNLALLLPWLGVTVRRLHDTDRSGWWLLLFFLPFFLAGFFAAFSARLDGADSGPFSSMGALMILVIPVDHPCRAAPRLHGPAGNSRAEPLWARPVRRWQRPGRSLRLGTLTLNSRSTPGQGGTAA